MVPIYKHHVKAEPSRQPGSYEKDTQVEIGCHCLARTGSSVGAQLQDEASLHGKKNTDTSVLSMGYEAETTRHTPVLSARFMYRTSETRLRSSLWGQREVLHRVKGCHSWLRQVHKARSRLTPQYGI